MAIFTFFAYTAFELGASGFTPGAQFSAGGTVQTLSVNDDDPVLDDENAGSGQTVDSSEQSLAADFAPGQSEGQIVQSVFKYSVENTTTNETGTIYSLRVYEGTDPEAPGVQAGAYIFASDIEFSPGDSLSISDGNFIGQVDYASLAGPPAPCFARGAMIETVDGPVVVEDLKIGDLVITSDHGPQPIRWLGSRTIAAQGEFAPVVIGQGALGNDQELIVSPNHRIVVSGWQAEVLFGKAEVMVPAKSLLNGDTIYTRNGGDIEYFHLMFDRHQVIFANGVATESLHPGIGGTDLATESARREVLALFPHLEGDFANYGPPARVAVSGDELSLLV